MKFPDIKNQVLKFTISKNPVPVIILKDAPGNGKKALLTHVSIPTDILIFLIL